MRSLLKFGLFFLFLLFIWPAANAVMMSGITGRVNSYDGSVIEISSIRYQLVQSSKGNKYKALSCRTNSQLKSCETLKSYKGNARLVFENGVVTQIEMLDAVK